MSPVDSDEDDELPELDKLKWAKEIFEAMGEEREKLDYTMHSNKARMTLEIIKAAMAQKESVLVFFHSIPSLDYIEAKLRRKRYATHLFRLTGETNMKDRQKDVDRFQQSGQAVFLMSTKVFISYE
jgi:SNF2 family DNA or RNA helicase